MLRVHRLLMIVVVVVAGGLKHSKRPRKPISLAPIGHWVPWKVQQEGLSLNLRPQKGGAVPNEWVGRV